MKNFFSNKNKGLIGILGSLLIAVMLSSCVTGVDDSEILAEHNAWLVKTPRVLDLTVNGQVKTRDSLSHDRHFFVSAGDVVKIAATFDSGQEAKSSTFTIVRQYYGQVFGQEAAKPVEPLTEMDFDYGAGETEFNLDYTVPAKDDDDFDFESHNIITITITSLNDLGLASFMDVILEFK